MLSAEIWNETSRTICVTRYASHNAENIINIPSVIAEGFLLFNNLMFMPNWCSNSVVFSATEDNLEKIRNLFQEIQQKQKKKNSDHYHLPDFV